MDIGVGLPSNLPGVAGKTVVEWARRAEAYGFDSLAVIDRIVYSNYEPLIALAGAAAVTARIRLLTAILIGPYRTNTALLAKEIATLDALSGGRVMLGLAVGGRDDDYTGSGVSLDHLGLRLEAQIGELRRIWAGEPRGLAGPIGPRLSALPPIIIGGSSEPALKRTARVGDGWIMGSMSTPENIVQMRARIEGFWAARGRAGRPRIMALNHFALGPDALEAGRNQIRDYYRWSGAHAERAAQTVAGSAEEIRRRVKGFERVGCDELVLLPSVPEPRELDLLAAALGKRLTST